MSVDAAALSALVRDVARFYIREKTMRRAQAAMVDRLASQSPPTDTEIASYVGAVERYFGGFEREAREHLRDVDKRLGRASQLQYNLTAERDVTARRVEVTQGVLARVAEIAGR